jgi:hypothetical protein
MLKLESLHPGGLELTRELAELCKIQKSAKVLDIASGTSCNPLGDVSHRLRTAK